MPGWCQVYRWTDSLLRAKNQNLNITYCWPQSYLFFIHWTFIYFIFLLLLFCHLFMCAMVHLLFSSDHSISCLNITFFGHSAYIIFFSAVINYFTIYYVPSIFSDLGELFCQRMMGLCFISIFYLHFMENTSMIIAQIQRGEKTKNWKIEDSLAGIWPQSKLNSQFQLSPDQGFNLAQRNLSLAQLSPSLFIQWVWYDK